MSSVFNFLPLGSYKFIQNDTEMRTYKNKPESFRNLLPQKLGDSSEYWQMYLSSAPRIWAPTPVNRRPYFASSMGVNFLRNAGFSTEYMKQKLCLLSGIETLKYQPSKNCLLLPSKWYLPKEKAKQSSLKNLITTQIQRTI